MKLFHVEQVEVLRCSEAVPRGTGGVPLCREAVPRGTKDTSYAAVRLFHVEQKRHLDLRFSQKMRSLRTSFLLLILVNGETMPGISKR